MSNEEKWKDDFEEWFSELRASFCSERQWSLVEDILDNKYHMQNGYITGRQHSEKEIEELRSEKGLTGIIKASVNFASKNIELQKELEKYKEAYLVLKQGLAEADQSLTCSVNVGKIITEASKRAALILGEGE